MFEYDGVSIPSMRLEKDERVADWMRRVYLRLPKVTGFGRGRGSTCEAVHDIGDAMGVGPHVVWRIHRRLVIFGALRRVERGRFRKADWHPYEEPAQVRKVKGSYRA